MDVYYRVTGADELERFLLNLQRNAPRVLEHFVWHELALFAEKEISDRAPVRYGRLRGNIGRTGAEGHYRALGGAGGRIWVEIGTNVEYAAVLEYGAKPHPIVPKRAKVLAFYWEKLGAFVRFRRVRHPGNKAYAYFEGGVRYTESQALTLLQRRIATLGFV